MNDLISRKQAIKLIQKINDEHDSVYATSAIHDVVNGIEQLPSVNPQANDEDIHREREQAYMKGYEDASKRYRTEHCEDAISRSEAIRIASGYCHWSNIPAELAKLPSVNTEKTGWIPVSERLPEDGIYLVTVERIAGEPRIETKSFAKDLHRVDDYDFPEHKCGWYEYDSEYGYWEDTDVIAWMPLPKPYQKDGDDE